jgi:hypothetical protein
MLYKRLKNGRLRRKALIFGPGAVVAGHVEIVAIDARYDRALTLERFKAVVEATGTLKAS